MPTGERQNQPRRTSVCFDLIPLPGDSATHLMGSKGEGRAPSTLAERLWPKVAGPWCDGVGDDDCWLWLGGLGWAGKRRRWWYGRIRGEGGGMTGAHIAALVVTGHPKPGPGYLACHRCNQHLCCNPRHLYWGTVADNMTDQVGNGTRSFVPGSVYSRSAVSEWMADEELERALAEQVAV